MGMYDPKRTLDPQNQLHIVCPIFNAETPIAACFTLRELVWCGKPPQVRKGCQVCMRANKCPINNIIWDMVRHPDTDPYWSDQKKVAHFKQHHLDQIARVTVPESLIVSHELSDKEVLMIRRANNAAKTGAISRGRPERDAPIEPVVDEATLTAAKTGDMSAAINAALKDT